MVNVRGILIAIVAADSVGAVQVGLGEGALRARLRLAARQRQHLACPLHSKLCSYVTKTSFYLK